MKFVDLNRHFVPVLKDKEAALDLEASWGFKYGGWLSWNELLAKHRIVLLAEALSGKTYELEGRADTLRSQGKYAFFVRIEDLADDSFEGALDENQIENFHKWKSDNFSDAWFFLDSVDEARLNNKTLSSALRKFSKELQLANLGRAHILVSCRASDWKGSSDRAEVEQLLPLPQLPQPQVPAGMDPDEDLLTPIFQEEDRNRRTIKKQDVEPVSKIDVVQLVPLTREQKGKLAGAKGVTDTENFLNKVDQNGLDSMTERPGDLIDLVGHWLDHKTFGTLEKMTEAGIKRKLREENTFRRDSGVLNFERLREGAERLAAGLVLGKTFTLKSAAQEHDPTLAIGALDPNDILPDWDQEEINTLLRRGIFAPSTYGRLRFHHRSSQEYLAACWFQRLLKNNCPLSEIEQVIFSDMYKIRTIKPALRSIAAWLSLWNPQIREGTIKCDPVCLITNGDPKSFDIDIRAKLLVTYADLHVKGHVNHELINHRASWMFSSENLHSALRSAWNANDRGDFRLHLLSFIENAAIKNCADLALKSALDPSQSDYVRIIAARALTACNDKNGLRKLATQVNAEPDKLNARLAPELAVILYPEFLSLKDLIGLINQSIPGRPYQSEGFGKYLSILHSASPNRNIQKKFAYDIADLFDGLYLEEDIGENSRHSELSKGLAELAITEIRACKNTNIDPGLIRLLMATESSWGGSYDSDLFRTLAGLVQQEAMLNRELIWANSRIHRLKKDQMPSNIWRIGPYKVHRLWSIGLSDLEWLISDCRTRSKLNEKRIAFSAIYSILQSFNMLAEKEWQLKDLITVDPILKKDLKEFQRPPAKNPYEKRNQQILKQQENQKNKAKQSWVDFRNKLNADHTLISNIKTLKSWKSGLYRLYNLTHWLQAKARLANCEWSSNGPLLSIGFSEEIAKHYTISMSQVWRQIIPERPIHDGKNTFTTKHTSTLAVNSLELDSQSSGWEFHLTDVEIRRALNHGCYSEQSSTNWFDRLVKTHPIQASKIITSAIKTEYDSVGVFSDLISTAAYKETAARTTITQQVFNLLRRREPVDDTTFERVIKIVIQGIKFIPKNALHALIVRRIHENLVSQNQKRAIEYLVLYAHVDPENFVEEMYKLLRKLPQEKTVDHLKRTRQWLGILFDQEARTSRVSSALTKLPVPKLLKLIQLVLQLLPDSTQKSTNTELDVHEAIAIQHRHSLVNYLISRAGSEAFHAIQVLAKNMKGETNTLYLAEISHLKAATDGDLTPWNMEDVVKFERRHVAPAKTGEDLLKIVHSVLSDIASSFDHDDASSRSVVALAQDEDAVQDWLAEQLNLRAKGRFHAHREPRIAKKNKPDIIVSSTAADLQVAIEIKNANKGWTINDLEHALTSQLAIDYLRPKSRRHGILVISLHKLRTWRRNGSTWGFNRVIKHLRSTSQNVQINDTGPIEVSVFGINSVEQNYKNL